jgi:hypothetical protein
MVQVWMETAGIDVDATDKEGQTTLHLDVQYGTMSLATSYPYQQRCTMPFVLATMRWFHTSSKRLVPMWKQ